MLPVIPGIPGIGIAVAPSDMVTMFPMSRIVKNRIAPLKGMI